MTLAQLPAATRHLSFFVVRTAIFQAQAAHPSSVRSVVFSSSRTARRFFPSSRTQDQGQEARAHSFLRPHPAIESPSSRRRALTRATFRRGRHQPCRRAARGGVGAPPRARARRSQGSRLRSRPWIQPDYSFSRISAPIAARARKRSWSQGSAHHSLWSSTRWCGQELSRPRSSGPEPIRGRCRRPSGCRGSPHRHQLEGTRSRSGPVCSRPVPPRLFQAARGTVGAEFPAAGKYVRSWRSRHNFTQRRWPDHAHGRRRRRRAHQGVCGRSSRPRAPMCASPGRPGSERLAPQRRAAANAQRVTRAS